MIRKLAHWHAGLSKLKKTGLWSALGIGVVLALDTFGHPTSWQPAPIRPISISADARASSPKPLPKPLPVTQQTATAVLGESAKRITETVSVPYITRTIADQNQPLGSHSVRVAGKNGVRIRLYQVTYVDKQETNRRLISETMTVAPIDEVIVVGTKQPTADSTPTPATPDTTAPAPITPSPVTTIPDPPCNSQLTPMCASPVNLL